MRTLFIPLFFAVMASACTPTIDFALKIFVPCDQAEALKGVGTFRFEITGKEMEAMTSNFTRSKEQGQITDLPLADNMQVTVKGYAGDVDKDKSILTKQPLAVGATQPRDFTAESERTAEANVLVGKVETFASTTDAAKGKCTSMAAGRHGHTVTYLPKVGKVLIVGGAKIDENGNDQFLATVELFDPSTGEYETLPAPPGGARSYHAAVAFPDGRALITGGLGLINSNVATLGSGYVYDPSEKAKKSPYTMVIIPGTEQARAHHTLTLADTGSLVLMAGGCQQKNSNECGRDNANFVHSTTLLFDLEQFDKGATTLENGPEMPDDKGRVFHQALSVGEGLILIAGGLTNGAGTDLEPACRLLVFDTRSRDFREEVQDDLPTEACTGHLAATMLDDNTVLMTGGYRVYNGGAPSSNPSDLSSSTTIWDMTTTQGSRVKTGPSLTAGRAGHVLFPLAGKKALVVGGTIEGTAVSEIIDMDASSSTATQASPAVSRHLIGATTLGSGQPLMLGGIDFTSGSGSSVATGELFFW